MKFMLFISFHLILTNVAAQDFAADLILLKRQTHAISPVEISKEKRAFKPLTILYSATLGFYQNQISPQWGANCAFETTCSRFSRQAVTKYGLAKGFFLSLDRLGRCNKISFYETVPIRINAQNKIIDKVDFYQLP